MYAVSVDQGIRQSYHAMATSYAFSMGRSGVNPIDALLESLCAGVVRHIRDRAVDRRIDFDLLTVTARGELTSDQSALARVVLKLSLPGETVTAAQSTDLLAQACRCPIFNTLAKCTEIAVTLADDEGD